MSNDIIKPPRFRDSGFIIRWEQGRWAEEKIMEAINDTNALIAIPYGRSQIGPKDKDKIKTYYAEYRKAEKYGKRPDILVFDINTYEELKDVIPSDPTITPEDELEEVVRQSLCGIEAENSLWYGKKMPDYGKTPPFKSKKIVLPRVWIKYEDVPRLLKWEEHYNKKYGLYKF